MTVPPKITRSALNDAIRRSSVGPTAANAIIRACAPVRVIAAGGYDAPGPLHCPVRHAENAGYLDAEHHFNVIAFDRLLGYEPQDGCDPDDLVGTPVEIIEDPPDTIPLPDPERPHHAQAARVQGVSDYAQPTVLLDVSRDGEVFCQNTTPAAARRLAFRLMVAADRAEGRG